MNIALRGVRSTVIGFLVLGVLVFLPAGTLAYWQGWAFVVVFTVSTGLIGIDLAVRDPALLERRLRAGPGAETRPVQKLLVALAFAAVIALVVVSALDHRMGWSRMPAWVAVFGNMLVALGLLVDLRVFRENSYGAATIRVMPGQRVVSTGPYALVRHPMYAGALVLLLGAPLALGSWWGLAFPLLSAPVLMLRILDEERMLEAQLPGYADYMGKVRYRLVPGLW